MKVSLNWLKDYIDIDLDANKIANILTDTGLEVEGVEEVLSIQGGLENVVIGQVIKCEKHPDADRLKVTFVNVGENENLQIVCGAPNVAEGQKVIVAKVGAVLYPKPDESFKIKKSKIRGVESFGMICAEDELGIGTSHDGILVLEERAVIGQKAAEYFDLKSDHILEIGLTPNRADAMGHIGVARDLKAYLNVHHNANLQLKLPSVDQFKADNNTLNVNIKVHDEELCPRYAGLTIDKLQVKASPEWLQKKLRVIGLNPINNVVDATNFVLHELGTPLHAFDKSVVGNEINIRKAKKGEKLTTLDEVERTLSENNLVIANEKEALCLAGIMGGKNSGVSEKTTSIFLEAAYFNPVSIRKTAKEFGINSDASFRFERGIDIEMVSFALKRAALLIQSIAGGEISMEVTDLYPNKTNPFQIAFRPIYCNKIIGTDIESAVQTKILEELDIEVQNSGKDAWQLAVPTYRVDVQREIDVVEEILRVYGFNKVELPEKMSASLTFRNKLDVEKLQNKTSNQLVDLGFFEMMNNSLTNANYVEKLGGKLLNPEHNVTILNPLSNELNTMRQTLLFQTLETIAYNQNRQQADVKLFEFGKTYKKFGKEHVENKRLLVAISGKKTEESWNNNNESATIFTLKGIVVALLNKLGIAHFVQEETFSNDFGEGILLQIRKTKLVEIYTVDNQIQKQFDIKQAVYVADIDWDAVLQNATMNKIKYTPLPKTQIVRRDFSLLIDKEIHYNRLKDIAFTIDKKLLKGVNLFDVYEGKNIENGKIAYSLSFLFQDNEKTLQDKQVDAIMQKIRSEYENELGAKLR